MKPQINEKDREAGSRKRGADMDMGSVLLVDDESMVRIGVRTCVDWEGLGITDVYEASNGSEALKVLQSHKVDLIITDIKMSVMDGFAMLEELKLKEHIPEVIVMSCYNDYENMRQAMAYGVKDFLFKPKMYPEDIEEAIRKVKGNIAKNREGTRQEAQDIIQSVDKDNYLQQFENLSRLIESCELEIKDGIQMSVGFLNRLMGIDDTGEPMLHTFSTILFNNLYEIRRCASRKELLTVMDSIIRRSRQEGAREVKEEVFRALQYIDLHLTDVNLSQDIVAEHVGLSVSYFCRMFKNNMGISYSNYIIKRRIELADKLLRTTDKKVYEIAGEVGYTNERYFSRLYKEQTGHTMKRG